MKTARILLWMIPCILLVLPGAHGGTAGIRILYVNDFHGYAEPYTPLGSDNLAGGLSFLAHKVHQLREGPPSLLLAAGDMIQESLRKRISEASFPVLGANVQGLESLKPYTIATVGDMRAVLIGVVTEETPVSTHPRNTAGLSFGPPAEALRKILEEIRGKVDLVVVLSHCGYAADRALAESVDGIDVIVGGHSHTRLLTPTRVHNTWIVQAWEHGKSLGVLDLAVERGRVTGAEGRLEDISPAEGGPDGAVLAIVEKHRQRADAVLEEKIGEASVDLDGVNVRRRETNLGNLVADIIRKTAGADAALINGGTIRTGIRKGDIRVKDVYSVLPFDSYPVAIRLTGKQVRDALEHGVSGIAEGAGRFPQVSGIRSTTSAKRNSSALPSRGASGR
jgi:5'-nucleotidase/UDP-sugar diphosphatase